MDKIHFRKNSNPFQQKFGSKLYTQLQPYQSHKNLSKITTWLFNGKPIILNNQQKVLSKNGQDQRRKIERFGYPFSAIGLLSTINLNKQGKKSCLYATAFLIWHNIALTAAHCVYCRQLQQQREQLYITIKSEYSQKQYQIACAYIPNQYITQSNKNSKKFDYALLVLNTTQRLGDQFKMLPIACPTFKKNSNQNVQIYGYPKDKNKQKIDQMLDMYGCLGNISNIQDGLIKHLVDTSPGQSGGALLQKNKKGEHQAIGIHICAFQDHNVAVSFTEQNIANIMAWRRQNFDQIVPNYSKEIIFFGFSKNQIKKLKSSLNFSQQKLNTYINHKISYSIQDQIQKITTTQNALEMFDNIENMKSTNSVSDLQQIKLYEGLSKVFLKIEGLQSQNFIKIQFQIGFLYFNQQNYDKSLEYLLKCRQMKSQDLSDQKKRQQHLYILSAIKKMYILKGLFVQTISIAEQYLFVVQKTKGRNNVEYIQNLLQMIEIHCKQNIDLNKQIDLMTKLIEIIRKDRQLIDLQRYLKNLNYLGKILYFQKRDKKLGKQYLEQSLFLIEEMQNFEYNQPEAELLCLYGKILYEQNQISLALKTFKNSKKIYQKLNIKGYTEFFCYKEACKNINQIRIKNQLKFNISNYNKHISSEPDQRNFEDNQRETDNEELNRSFYETLSTFYNSGREGGFMRPKHQQNNIQNPEQNKNANAKKRTESKNKRQSTRKKAHQLLKKLEESKKSQISTSRNKSKAVFQNKVNQMRKSKSKNKGFIVDQNKVNYRLPNIHYNSPILKTSISEQNNNKFSNFQLNNTKNAKLQQKLNSLKHSIQMKANMNRPTSSHSTHLHNQQYCDIAQTAFKFNNQEKNYGNFKKIDNKKPRISHDFVVQDKIFAQKCILESKCILTIKSITKLFQIYFNSIFLL